MKEGIFIIREAVVFCVPFVESPDVNAWLSAVALVDLMLGSIEERLSYEPSLKFKTELCLAR